jgi:hypothetical protein
MNEILHGFKDNVTSEFCINAVNTHLHIDTFLFKNRLKEIDI